jgi:predicted esterase
MSKRPPHAVREGNTHALEWRLDGGGDAHDAPLLLALHGQGMTPAFFVALLAPLLDLPVRVLTPRAPLVHPVRGTKRQGPSWYAYDGDQRRFRAELGRTERLLTRFVDETERQLQLRPRARVLLGFSQGGYCGAYVALRRSDVFGGMVISGARVKVEILADEIRRAGERGFAALLCHGERDGSVDPAAARSSRDTLQAGGVAVRLHTFDSGHTLGREQLSTIRMWLDQHWEIGSS